MPLVVVLALGALISSFVAVALRTSLSGASAASAFVAEMRADELGRTAVDLVAYRIMSGGQEARRGGSFAASFGDCVVTVDYVSESARVDVNHAVPALIGAVFRAAGAEPEEATDIVARIVAWRDPEQRVVGAGLAGRGGEQPSSATSHLLQRTEEISTAWGVPDRLWIAARSSLTVANGSAKVDPTLAQRLVIVALMGEDGPRVDDFIARRGNGFASANDVLALLPAQARGFAEFAPANAVRAVARVVVARGLERSYEFVVMPPTAPGKGVNVLSWQPSW